MDQSDKYFIPIDNICNGCISRVTNVGTEVGCEQCDENWDLPDLIIEANNNICNGCISRVTNVGTEVGCEQCDENWDLPDLLVEKSECEGCKLLDAGLGGENQQGHSCIGY